MLARVDALDADIAGLDRKLEELIAPFMAAADRLDEITGVGRTAACVIIAEIGTDMGRFPTPGAREAAAAAGRTDTFLGERYRRIARRRGTKRAIVAVGRSILVIIWHLLADPDTRFHDLGPGFYDTRINPERAKRNHIRQLEALGYQVTLQPAA
jgi:transposase